MDSPNHYLVVEGVINNGADSTIVKLSRTVNISGSVSSSGVDNCTVSVEAEGGASYSLSPQGNGAYLILGLSLDASKKYRLHIVTNDSQEYASDYVEVKKTQPIDSVGFYVKNGNLQIYANTHDPANNTRYYRWSYDETWKFHARYQSSYIVDRENKTVVARPGSEANYYCFAGDKSTTIVIGSSAKLSQDVIFQQPITTIASTSEKVEMRYSILLKQYALTKEAYQFWENMKKNTEQLGSIFDAQPSQLTGNIHNLKDPAEPVIGYVSVTNVQAKRVFIDNVQVPHDWVAKYPYDCGPPDTALFFNPKTQQNEVLNFIINGVAVPVADIKQQMNVIGYTYSSVECTDCRIRGRVQAPAFWTEQ
ncbi:DUF4249 domain-containing protein [Mucilaginibacter sp. SMC90]|uniref:DUF4249 domain-containing protein n=1 Tax=Mucilaginibacter sp. SMC90 TaxID=2929803 RepID=UPI001FB2B821|nr:DUF4249 domain-containing protein [Mucilaginibacter sp. SMC90]UOE49881.1 DUF4249 domain-containing protein [Mucilaginibacter sp. SMC90]